MKWILKEFWVINSQGVSLITLLTLIKDKILSKIHQTLEYVKIAWRLWMTSLVNKILDHIKSLLINFQILIEILKKEYKMVQ
jgi:hypothetical protein